ncbi:uncharacterized protein GLRG_03702 [Colletotrichum graminicola M1.001]|uniref:Uncharacterized protein n=1 Tax=Colletotrichum graminicola (strain M1.001 / M2 / FGSC 10212) TaxID=645133 RepID=E3QCH0_COLGM|nr:uncharacterized protein GLRG_03702 [Colletotrichum graminicola M1.001]EFQ28558.1 hypothetical protein GLRG_03702 [Colletotrichum graminicola M1.001]
MGHQAQSVEFERAGARASFGVFVSSDEATYLSAEELQNSPERMYGYVGKMLYVCPVRRSLARVVIDGNAKQYGGFPMAWSETWGTIEYCSCIASSKAIRTNSAELDAQAVQRWYEAGFRVTLVKRTGVAGCENEGDESRGGAGAGEGPGTCQNICHLPLL